MPPGLWPLPIVSMQATAQAGATEIALRGCSGGECALLCEPSIILMLVRGNPAELYPRIHKCINGYRKELSTTVIQLPSAIWVTVNHDLCVARVSAI